MSDRPLTPQPFVARWRDAQQSGRTGARQQFLDLCALLGKPVPANADPTGTFFTFEKGVTKTGGGQGLRQRCGQAHA